MVEYVFEDGFSRYTQIRTVRKKHVAKKGEISVVNKNQLLHSGSQEIVNGTKSL